MPRAALLRALDRARGRRARRAARLDAERRHAPPAPAGARRTRRARALRPIRARAPHRPRQPAPRALRATLSGSPKSFETATRRVHPENTLEKGSEMNLPPIVTPQEWEAAREELLVKEKELTHAHDALAAQRRRMPRMAVEKDYVFDGPEGKVEPARPLRRPPPADRLPLLLDPEYAGWRRLPRLRGSDDPRLIAHDTTLALVSRAPPRDRALRARWAGALRAGRR